MLKYFTSYKKVESLFLWKVLKKVADSMTPGIDIWSIVDDGILLTIFFYYIPMIYNSGPP